MLRRAGGRGEPQPDGAAGAADGAGADLLYFSRMSWVTFPTGEPSWQEAWLAWLQPS